MENTDYIKVSSNLVDSDITQVAINEIMNPAFTLTEQYLRSNKLRMESNLPQIEDIIISDDKSTAEVYFPVLNEPYYLVIYLDLRPVTKVRFMNMSAGNRVELLISSDITDLDEFISLLQITPKRKWTKGQNRDVGKSHYCRPYQNNGFIYAPIDKTTGEVEYKINHLLDKLITFKDEIRELKKVAATEIQITYYGYKDEMWGINLQPHMIQMLSEMGVSLDIDLYASGNDLNSIS